MRSGSGCARCCHPRAAGGVAAGVTTSRWSTGSSGGSAPGRRGGTCPSGTAPWQTCYKRFARWETDGTWARIQQAVQRDADAAGELDWQVQVDTSVVRAHQHAAGARKGG